MKNQIKLPVINDNPTREELDTAVRELLSQETDMDNLKFHGETSNVDTDEVKRRAIV